MDVNTDYRKLTNPYINATLFNYPVVIWGLTNDGIYTDNVELKLRIATTETNLTNKISDGYYLTSYDDGVLDCSPQRYQLVFKNGAFDTTYLIRDKFVYVPAGKRQIDKIIVSKGYYPDKVNVKWTIPKGYDEFSNFRVMRKQLDETDEAWASIGGDISHTRGILSYNYDDANLNAGIYYEYKVEGYHTCHDTTDFASSPSSVGFSQPYGSVSGRITYTGSSAVEGVTINLLTDNALSSNRELVFAGSGTNYVNIPAQTKLLNPEGFSFQVWLKRENKSNVLLLSNGSVIVGLNSSNRPYVTLGGKTLTAGSAVVIPENEYTHLTVTASKSGSSSYDVRIYVNGELKANSTLTSVTALSNTAVIRIGSNSTGDNAYKGTMDDIRFWNKVLTENEITLNYDRILSGKETGFAAYYKCDEFDRIDGELYDCSASGTLFNGNHAVKGSGVARINVPVTAEHILLKGVTDADGIYSITNSIPYTSEGTTYSLVPSFGIHQFDPGKRPIFFSPDSKVFNNVDFTDISSFPVSGRVVYAGSNYPVEGVQISIDGIVASRDGKIIETDTYGDFSIDVPIGSHFISVSKGGHVFTAGGRFPANDWEKYNFQTSVNGLMFYDETTVNIVGRVAGGKPQNDKPLGFGLSKANIGKAKVTLVTNNDVYRLNLTGADSTVNTTIPGGAVSKTTFKYAASGTTIEIETDPATGEFLAVLPPGPYSIKGIKTADFEDTFVDGDEKDFQVSKEMFNPEPAMKQTLEYTDAEKKITYSLEVHDSVRIIRYNEPSLLVRDRSNDYGAFGDSIYVYVEQGTGNRDTLRLYTVAGGGTVSYTAGAPVFNQDRARYDWEVESYEEYINRDDPAVVS
jgi:hypothetical protein